MSNKTIKEILEELEKNYRLKFHSFKMLCLDSGISVDAKNKVPFDRWVKKQTEKLIEVPNKE